MLTTRGHLIISLVWDPSEYQIFRNRQCLNDLRVRIHDLGISITWPFPDQSTQAVDCLVSLDRKCQSDMFRLESNP